MFSFRTRDDTHVALLALFCIACVRYLFYMEYSVNITALGVAGLWWGLACDALNRNDLVVDSRNWNEQTTELVSQTGTWRGLIHTATNSRLEVGRYLYMHQVTI